MLTIRYATDGVQAQINFAMFCLPAVFWKKNALDISENLTTQWNVKKSKKKNADTKNLLVSKILQQLCN